MRGQTGAWRPALAMLRKAETDFPEQAAPIHDRLKDAFAAMIRDMGAQQVPPIEFVAMVEENTDLVPDSGEDELVGQSLADRLMALDLPTRAKPVLQKLMKQTKNPIAKARFGTSLAMLNAREGDDAGALAVLDGSEAPDLPADIAEQRLILRAGSVAHQGDPTVSGGTAGAGADRAGDGNARADSGDRVGLGWRRTGVVGRRRRELAGQWCADRGADADCAASCHGDGAGG